MTNHDQRRKALRRAALESHKAGESWLEFWGRHGREASELEPYSASRFRRLQMELLHLCASGERSGQFGVGDPDAIDPWLIDDGQLEQPHDTETSARLQLPLPGFAGVAH